MYIYLIIILYFINDRYVPPSPAGLVEDIAEIMHKERQEEDSINESVYETDTSVAASKASDYKKDENTDNVSNKRVRKSLETTWETSTDMPYLAETPVSLYSKKNFIDIHYLYFIHLKGTLKTSYSLNNPT